MTSKMSYILAGLLLAGSLFAQSENALEFLDENSAQLTVRQASVLQKIKSRASSDSVMIMLFRNLQSIKNAGSMQAVIPGIGAFVSEQRRNHSRSADMWSWSGSLPNEGGEVALYVTGSSVHGMIHIHNVLFTLEPLGNGIHALVRINPSGLSPDEPEDWNTEPPFRAVHSTPRPFQKQRQYLRLTL